MKKILKISLILIIFAIAIFLANESYAANLSVNVNFDGKQIEMTSETPNMSWSIDNLLPGETEETILTINNIGTRQANIKFIANIEEGEELSDILNIKIIKLAGEVQKQDEEFFIGKYSKLMNIELDLQEGKTQAFKIITSLPKETGNEYQNKECKIKLSFIASGIEDAKPAPEEPPKEIVTDVIKPVQTGESKTIYIVAGVLVVAVAFLVVTFFVGRNKKKK